MVELYALMQANCQQNFLKPTPLQCFKMSLKIFIKKKKKEDVIKKKRIKNLVDSLIKIELYLLVFFSYSFPF